MEPAALAAALGANPVQESAIIELTGEQREGIVRDEVQQMYPLLADLNPEDLEARRVSEGNVTLARRPLAHAAGFHGGAPRKLGYTLFQSCL